MNNTTHCQHEKQNKAKKRESGSSPLSSNHKATKKILVVFSCEECFNIFWVFSTLFYFSSFCQFNLLLKLLRKRHQIPKCPCRLKAVCYRFSSVLFSCIFVLYFKTFTLIHYWIIIKKTSHFLSWH